VTGAAAGTALASSLALAWREGVSIEPIDGRGIAVQAAGLRLSLRGLSAPVAQGLDALSTGPEHEERLADRVLAEGGHSALAEWYFHVQALMRRGMLVRVLRVGAAPAATLVPIAGRFEGTAPPPVADTAYRLSRFALMRRDGDNLCLEAPTAGARLLIHQPLAAAMIAALAVPATAEETSGRVTGWDGAAVSRLFALLASAGLSVAARPGELDGDDASPGLRCWEFHDLAFHARSRRGRHDAPLGATYRFVGRIEVPAAIAPPVHADAIALDRPDLERSVRDDPPLAQVMESRRSIRQYGARPVSVRQLGEFLYRVARVTRVHDAAVETPDGSIAMTFAHRPYPSGGGLYELEFSVVVQACDGLAPGLYSYRGETHALSPTRASPLDVQRLAADAARSAGIAPESVQVLIVLSARFARLAWKYESIAYALVLKHVGVVYQTMYLAATAMGLAPCALGAGDSDLFARAAGTDYYAETSVGEFLLGSRAGPGA
jgi:SagB-type dehydrogenase family enzyme